MSDKQQNNMDGNAAVARQKQGAAPKNPVKEAKLANALRHNLQRRKQSQKANAANSASGE